MEPLLEGLLRSLGGSEANFLEVCLGRIPLGDLHTKATSKKSRPPPPLNFQEIPPEAFPITRLAGEVSLRWRLHLSMFGWYSKSLTCYYEFSRQTDTHTRRICLVEHSDFSPAQFSKYCQLTFPEVFHNQHWRSRWGKLSECKFIKLHPQKKLDVGEL